MAEINEQVKKEELKTMYPPVVNSPDTFLKEKLVASGTVMYVSDPNVLGKLPTLAVIGTGAGAETVLVKSQNGGECQIQRAINGYAKDWDKNTAVARNFTAYDYETLTDNIKILLELVKGRIKIQWVDDTRDASVNGGAQPDIPVNAVPGVLYVSRYGMAIVKEPKENPPISGASINAVASLLEFYSDETSKSLNAFKSTMEQYYRLLENKVDKKTGYELSQNNYDNEAKKKVDAIPANPKYTDTTYAAVTQSADGLMTKADKAKLDGIEAQANKTIIVNDLTTGGTDKALSAEQGKVLFQNVNDGKTKVANAIIGKGQSGVSNASTFDQLAEKIKAIKTGYAVGDTIPQDKIRINTKLGIQTKLKEYPFDGNVLYVDGAYAYVLKDKEVSKVTFDGRKIWSYQSSYSYLRKESMCVDYDGNFIFHHGTNLTKLSPNGKTIFDLTVPNSCNVITIDNLGIIYASYWDLYKKNTIESYSPEGKKVSSITENLPVNGMKFSIAGGIYTAGNSHKVIQYSTSFSKRWEYDGGDSIDFLATNDTGFAFFVTRAGDLYCIDIYGKYKWGLRNQGETIRDIVADRAGGCIILTDKSIQKYSSSGNKVCACVSGDGRYIFMGFDNYFYVVSIAPGALQSKITKFQDLGEYISDYTIIS